MRQSRDKVVDEFTNKSKYNQLLLKKFKFESHMCCQKPWLRPWLTAFVTQGLSCGPCEAITTAHAGSAFWARPWPAYGFEPSRAHHYSLSALHANCDLTKNSCRLSFICSIYLTFAVITASPYHSRLSSDHQNQISVHLSIETSL